MSDNLIRISTNIQDLTGNGTEYLVTTDSITGEMIVLEKFFNGNFIRHEYSLNMTEETPVLAVA